MKKIYTLFMVSAIALTTRAQLVINENFTSYSTGNLSGQPGGWIASGSGTDVQVKNTTSLTYTGYTAGGNYVTVGQTNGIDPYKTFSTSIPTSSNRTIYMSFLVRVTQAQEFSGGPDYSVTLLNTANSAQPCRFYIAEHNGVSTAIEFGIAVGSGSPSYTNGSFSYGTTYLIVIRYDITTGSGNDDVYLWVDPSLTSEPSTSTAINPNGANQHNTGEVAYGSAINALQIVQSSSSDSPISAYDAFRVAHGSTSATAWSNLNPQGASLPVTLTSFNANQDGLNNTKLIWTASNESGIVSYVVERSTDGRTFSDIGSVNASQQSTYSYTDNQASSDYTYYRLKMVEQDGSFKYSFIVSLKSKLSLNISLSPNPVRSTLLIQHPKVGTEAHIEIVNNGGQLIKDIRIPASAVLTSIDMNGLATGLYHVVFKNGTDVFSKMVLKQ